MNLFFRILLYCALAVLVALLGAQIAHGFMQQAGWDTRWYGLVEKAVGAMGLPLLACVVVLFVIRLTPKFRGKNPFFPGWAHMVPVAIMAVAYVVALFVVSATVRDTRIADLVDSILPAVLGGGYLFWFFRRRRLEKAARKANDPDNIFS